MADPTVIAAGRLPVMSEEEARAMAQSMAACCGLPLTAEYLPGVVQHLLVAQAIAADVLAFDLADETEPAPVFRP